MDSATVALSKFKTKYSPVDINNCWCVVSNHTLCEQMNNKLLSEKFFITNELQTFSNTINRFPKIIKHKYGFGSKEQYIVRNKDELSILKKRIPIEDYIIQDFIEGQETSVDIYINKANELVGYVLRDREAVSDGEVMDCCTRNPNMNEQKLIEKIIKIKGWQGCITLQYIKSSEDKIYVVEINPRFGGGTTCAIECGLNMPLYILSDYIGLQYRKPNIKNIRMVRARRDFYLNI